MVVFHCYVSLPEGTFVIILLMGYVSLPREDERPLCLRFEPVRREKTSLKMGRFFGLKKKVFGGVVVVF